MKENQPSKDHRIFQQYREFNEYLRKLYPADNELGFDPSKVGVIDEQRQELIERREKLDIELKKSGRTIILSVNDQR